MHETSPLLDPKGLDDLLLYRFSRVSATAGAMIVRLCEGRFGITWREWRMVLMLAEAGALQPSALAAQVQLDRARTSRAITSLLAKGLLVRTVQADDQRRATVALTAAGQGLHDALFPLVAEINRQLLAPLQAAEVLVLDGLLQRIQQASEQVLAGAAWPKADRRRGRSPAA